MTNFASTDFAFCTLAFGDRYRIMAKELALDLQKYVPGVFLIVGTDKPQDFQNCSNIKAFKHRQTGILHCYNDKRFVLERCFLEFKTAIYLDADTRITGRLSDRLSFSPGILGIDKHLIDHVTKYRPRDLEHLKAIASKLNIDIAKARWIGESLLIVTQDEGREREFLKTWGTIASYLELKGMYSGEGSIIGLAATKVGWKVDKTDSWEAIDKIRYHLDASQQKKSRNSWQIFTKKLGYHYRLNKSRLAALLKFNFYYR
jgi:hypothetical protein